MADTSSNVNLKQLEDLLELYFLKKAPALPTGAKEAIVKFGPWVMLVMIIMTLPLVLTLFGIGTVLAPFSYLGGVNVGLSYTISMLLVAVSLVLEALALPGLFKKEMRSWNLVYYATLVSALQNAVSLNIVGLLIGAAISFYILFQVKSYYK